MLREPVEVALAEVEMIERLGVQVETGVEFGASVSYEELARTGSMPSSWALGLGATPALGIPGEELIAGWPRLHRAEQD